MVAHAPAREGELLGDGPQACAHDQANGGYFLSSGRALKETIMVIELGQRGTDKGH